MRAYQRNLRNDPERAAKKRAYDKEWRKNRRLPNRIKNAVAFLQKHAPHYLCKCVP